MSEVFRNLNWSALSDIFTAVIPALICIIFHELAHGYTAYCLGDTTAKDMGRLTVNPIKHIDVFGLLMLVVLKFGWAKPVPVDMRNFKRPKWYMAITAIAGPLSNIILAVIILFIFGLVVSFLGVSVTLHEVPDLSDKVYVLSQEGTTIIVAGEHLIKAAGIKGFIIQQVYFTAFISVGLAIFNMLPIPPLDGSKILFSLLPEKTYFKLMRYERYGMILLLILVSIDTVLNTNIFGATIVRLRDTLLISFNAIWLTVQKLVS